MYTGLDSAVQTEAELFSGTYKGREFKSTFGGDWVCTSSYKVFAGAGRIGYNPHTSICAYSRSPLSLTLLAGAVAGSTNNGKRKDSPSIVTDSHWLCSVVR
jgi:hypothetical protein